MSEENAVGSVLVVGAGIAGIKSALELAETGYDVILTDSSPAIGGILQKLDHQFPTDHCGMCRMLPLVGREHASENCMRKSLFHDNIQIMPFTEVASIKGDAGAYHVGLIKQARHINTDTCNGLGKCIEVCPVEVPDEFNQGLTTRKAIYQPVPHNVPGMLMIDMQACTKCGECLKVCPSNAIDLDAKDEMTEIDVQAIILAAGTSLYDAQTDNDAKAYAVSPNVVTSLAFERMLSGTGTFDGVIHRPSDGKPAKRIAWIQCVGSRNRRQDRDYCSSICCMFALKEAVLAHEKGGPDVETTIFYMDMRTFGKEFYRYRMKAEDEHGVRLVRCRVQSVHRQPDGSLFVRYLNSETGEFTEGVYDLVVLSTGQAPFEGHRKLAELLDVELAPSRLLPTGAFEKVTLTKPGVFVCGSLMGLTDISEAVTSGIAAASEASKLLASLGTERIEQQPAAQRPIERETPLVSVVLCSCKGMKGPDNLNLDPLIVAVKRHPCVGEAHVVDLPCREEGQQELNEILEQTQCNRLILGVCLPYVYRQKLKNMAQAAGFNPSLVQLFDLLNMVRSNSAGTNGDDWARRAYDEIIALIEKLRLAEALQVHRLPIEQSALVIGGGVTGMRAALSLADRGVQVHLVEKTDRLGGHAGAELHYTVDGLNPAELVASLKQGVEEQKNISVSLNSEIVESKGSLGCFTTLVRDNGSSETMSLRHGAAILATGSREAATNEYSHGENDSILTQSEFEKQFAQGSIDAGALQNIVMIQCVGSREKGGREYCSRICCAAALKNAFKILEKNPEARVYILNRDMMTYGFLEQYYTKARAEGVIFINYEVDRKPEVEIVEGKPVVKCIDPVLQMPLEVAADLLVLAPGIEPNPSNKDLASIFSLSTNQDGFLEEADSKWRPVESNKLGIFIAGTAHSPLPLSDAIMQAEAAAHKAFVYLSRKTIETARAVSKVHDSLCAACQLCVSVCPYNARAYSEELKCIVVDSAACQACGLCAVTCPNKAAEVSGWSEKQMLAMIDAKLGDGYTRQAAKEVAT